MKIIKWIKDLFSEPEFSAQSAYELANERKKQKDEDEAKYLIKMIKRKISDAAWLQNFRFEYDFYREGGIPPNDETAKIICDYFNDKGFYVYLKNDMLLISWYQPNKEKRV